MITVSILINGNPIATRSAVNVGYAKEVKVGKNRRCEYKVDDGSIIHHDPDRGAVELAKKLLDTIQEVK